MNLNILQKDIAICISTKTLHVCIKIPQIIYHGAQKSLIHPPMAKKKALKTYLFLNAVISSNLFDDLSLSSSLKPYFQKVKENYVSIQPPDTFCIIFLLKIQKENDTLT